MGEEQGNVRDQLLIRTRARADRAGARPGPGDPPRRLPRRWVLAPNAFKETLTAAAAARALAAGIRRARPGATCLLLPVADGGDGTLDALVHGTGGRFRTARVADPLGRPIRARFGLSGDGRLGFVEMARASGLALLAPHERDPLRTCTRGTGELIARLLDLGVEEIVVAVGGSATVDAGTGAARALGVRFLDARGRDLPPGGGALARLAAIDVRGRDARLDRVRVRVACDVRNPLLGPLGAARVFGPQKGARPRDVRRLERGLARWERLAHRVAGCALARLPGGGAAGGLAAGLHAFAGARLERGAELVLGLLDFQGSIRPGDIVVVGEGRLDLGSWMGKAPIAAAQAARRAGAAVIAVCGSADPAAARRFARAFGPVRVLPPGSARAARAARELARMAKRLPGVLSPVQSRR